MRSRKCATSSRSGTAPSFCRESPNVYKIEEGRAGRARSHPSHLRRCARRTRSRKYLAEDELKLYRLIWMRFVASPDDAGGLRSDHHRRRGEGQGRRRLHVPRHRLGAQVRRLPQGLRRRQGPEGRRRRRAEAQAAGGGRRRDAEASRRSGRSSTSPSRRRASTKPRWSRSWKPTASAGRPPTPRFSPPFRSAST